MLFGSIEGGGTKFKVAVGNENGEVFESETFPTTTPEETMKKVYDFFDDKEFVSIGIGSFGPIDVHKESDTYGFITNTPKKYWDNFDFVGSMQRRYPNIKIGFDTDVNVAALGEKAHGAGTKVDNLIYLTIGTGVGGGLIVNNQLVHGMLHPEMGHILLTKHPEDDFEGICPFHKNCLEGLACGPAIEKRWKVKGQDLPVNHKAWDIEAYYIAQALVNFILIVSPEKIILGGGVMHQPTILPKVKEYVSKMLNNYVKSTELLEDIDNYIVLPGLNDDAGIVGGLVLAKQVYEEKSNY